MWTWRDKAATAAATATKPTWQQQLLTSAGMMANKSGKTEQRKSGKSQKNKTKKKQWKEPCRVQSQSKQRESRRNTVPNAKVAIHNNE